MTSAVAIGAKAAYPDGVAAQVTKIADTGGKTSFILVITNESSVPIGVSESIGVTRGKGSDGPDAGVVHEPGSQPEWNGQIQPGRSAGELFLIPAKRSTLTDVTITFNGVRVNGSGPEGEPLVFSGSMAG